MPTTTPATTTSAIDALLDRVARESAGNPETNEIFCCEARDGAVALGYHRGAAVATVLLAQLDIYRGRLDAAFDALTAVAAAIDAHGSDADRLLCASLTAAAETRRGNVQRAADLFAALGELAERCPPGPERVIYLNRRGQACESLGDMDGALRHYFEALLVAEEIGAHVMQANMLSNLGSGQHDTGNDDDAVVLLTDALALIDEHEMSGMHSIAASNLAMCKMSLGDFDAAWDLLTPLIELPLLGQDPEDYAYFRLLAADALIMRGNLSLAERFVDHGLRTARQIGSEAETAHAEILRGQLALERGQADDALGHLDAADAAARDGMIASYRIKLTQLRARTLAALGRWQEAYAALCSYNEQNSRLRAAARKSRLQFRDIAGELQRSRAERDDALRREAEAVSINRELDRLNAELATRLKQVEQLREQLTEQSIKDHLTGIFNRRHFESRVHDLLAKDNVRFCIALIDLDFFKQINDSHGHAVGDNVLVAFARLLDSRLRGGDFVARHGGEEFCALMHRVSAEQAAERIRTIAAEFAALSVAGADAPLTGLTFSAGVAEYGRHGTTLDALTAAADKALYAVKHASRNAVRVAD